MKTTNCLTCNEPCTQIRISPAGDNALWCIPCNDWARINTQYSESPWCRADEDYRDYVTSEVNALRI